MRTGHHAHLSDGRIDYKELRKINPEAARTAVLEYLKTNPNISEAARMFSITRAVVYDILKKDTEGDLRDRSWAPRHQPRKTPAAVEDKVIEVKNRTHLGPERLSRYLLDHEGLSVPPGTIRHILRRNRGRLKYALPKPPHPQREKDGDSMTSFVMESFANVDGRGFQEQRYTARSWRRLLQGPVVEIDNKVPRVYY